MDHRKFSLLHDTKHAKYTTDGLAEHLQHIALPDTFYVRIQIKINSKWKNQIYHRLFSCLSYKDLRVLFGKDLTIAQ